jgi:hypothetical protein
VKTNKKLEKFPLNSPGMLDSIQAAEAVNNKKRKQISVPISLAIK